jgi:hypothetical protein
MSIIAAGTTTTTALSSTGNTDGTLQLQVNGTTPSVTLNTLGAVGVGSSPNFGTSGQVLVSAGSTAAPTWATPAAVNLATGVTGTLPVANGGTGQTALSAVAVGTATNLAGGSNGTIPYQSAAGTTQMLAVGTAGQVLQTNGAGAPSWVTVSAGAMTLITTSNYPTGGSATWNVPSVFSASYSNYIIYIDNLRMDSVCDLVYYGWNGSTTQNPANGAAVQVRNAAGQQGSTYSSVYLNLQAGSIGSSASRPFGAVMFINNYSGTTFYNGTYNSAYYDSVNDASTLNGAFVGFDTGAFNGFQLALLGGATFTQGKVYVYGLS